MMSDSEDEDVIYTPQGSMSETQGKVLIGDGSKSEDEVLNGPTDGRRLKKTIALFGAFIGLGLAVAVVGPTLHELQIHLHTDLPHVSYIFSGRSIGYVVGSIVGGVFLEYFNPLLIMPVTLAMSGIGLAIMPFFLRLGPTIITISLVGLATGALDTGATVMVLRMWGKKSAPFMQALHFSFALGALIAPLLASQFIPSNLTEVISLPTSIGANSSCNSSTDVMPTTPELTTPELPPPLNDSDGTEGNRRKRSAGLVFELPVQDQDNVNHLENSKRNNHVMYKRDQDNKDKNDDKSPKPKVTATPRPPSTTPKVATTPTPDSLNVTTDAYNSTSFKSHSDRFQGVYIIIGTFLTLMALVFIYFIYSSASIQITSSGNHSDLEKGISSPPDKKFTYYILGLLFVFYFLYNGAEVGYGGYIYTFAISVEMEPKTAANLNSLFWGTFAIMRGVSIFIASIISPLLMLIMDLLGCILSSLVLSYEADTNPTVLWVGTATLGASMASLFPAGISWLESHAPVTGKMASLLLVGSAFGEMVIPIILGQLFEPDSVGPMSLMYLMCGISLVTALIFGYAVYLAASEGKEVEGPMPEEENPALQILQGVQEEINLPTISLESKPGQVSKPVLIQKTHKE